MGWFADLLVWWTRNAKPAFVKPDMKVTDDHWLDEAVRKPIPGGVAMNNRHFLVIHDTEGWGAETSIDYWKRKNNGILAHIIIDRDGTVYQCRPFNKTCGHAGASKWRDPGTGKIYTGLNSNSIGIELANAGPLERETYPSTCGPEFAGKIIPRLVARHQNGGPVRRWEIYPQAQLAACARVAKALVSRYNLDDIVGHQDIAASRKIDPGPAYPLQVLRNSCGFTDPIGDSMG